MRISHSAKETYRQCSYKWKLHYQDRLRSKTMGSALFFGKALDDAFGRLLLEKKDSLTEDEKKLMEKTALEVFNEEFRVVQINGKSVDIASTLYVTYFTSDLDYSLLTKDEQEEVFNMANFLGFNGITNKDQVKEFIEECSTVIKSKDPEDELDELENRLFNYICWKSLRRKGEILLAKYEEEIIPQIEKVYSIQEKVELTDDEDLLVGYIDFVGSFVDEPGVKYIVDNKTSARPYKADSVSTSPQLSVYCEYKGIYNGAFIVVEKKLRKREPRVRINIIRDKVPDSTVEKTFQQFEDAVENIKNGTFEKAYHRDGGHSNCYAFGRKCQYFNYCRTGELDKLVYLEEPKNGSQEKKVNIPKNKS